MASIVSRPIWHGKLLVFSLDKTFELWINTLSGIIKIVPEKIRDKEIAKTTTTVRESNLSLKNLYSKYLEHSKNIPYWFYILTTLNCNYRCPICYEKNTPKTNNLSKETLLKIEKSILKIKKKKLIKNNRIHIIIFGGEPLCGDKSVLIEIFKTAKRNNWKIVIVTNGSMVENYIELFKKYKNTISDFRITLDGPKFLHNKRRPFKDGRGSYDTVLTAIDNLLENGYKVKMQTILGKENIRYLGNIAKIILKNGWHKMNNYQWRIEGSHDYANLDPKKDEISEGKMVKALVDLTKQQPKIKKILKFESFKYLGHITNSFEWLGSFKTYWGPKFAFCEPQKGFHYVFSTNGKIYHCPRTINNKNYLIGNSITNLNKKGEILKNSTILKKAKCKKCKQNTLCGGGCAVQKIYYKNFNCRSYASSIIKEFIKLMKKDIIKLADKNKIISINKPWSSKVYLN